MEDIDRRVNELASTQRGYEQFALNEGMPGGECDVASDDAPPPIQLERLKTWDPYEDDDDDALPAEAWPQFQSCLTVAPLANSAILGNAIDCSEVRPCQQFPTITCVPMASPGVHLESRNIQSAMRPCSLPVGTTQSSGAACQWGQTATAPSYSDTASGGRWMPAGFMLGSQEKQSEGALQLPAVTSFGHVLSAPEISNTSQVLSALEISNTSQAAPVIVAAQPQTLSRMVGANGSIRVCWNVDARKLTSSDRVAVSPPFEVSCGETLTFKMMISPKTNSAGRGATSFRKCKGRGVVQLKCEAQTNFHMSECVTFCVTLGRTVEDVATRQASGPVKHNFSHCGVCSLQEEWDFSKFVDDLSQTFVVCLEVIPT